MGGKTHGQPCGAATSRLGAVLTFSGSGGQLFTDNFNPALTPAQAQIAARLMGEISESGSGGRIINLSQLPQAVIPMVENISYKDPEFLDLASLLLSPEKVDRLKGLIEDDRASDPEFLIPAVSENGDPDEYFSEYKRKGDEGWLTPAERYAETWQSEAERYLQREVAPGAEMKMTDESIEQLLSTVFTSSPPEIETSLPTPAEILGENMEFVGVGSSRMLRDDQQLSPADRIYRGQLGEQPLRVEVSERRSADGQVISAGAQIPEAPVGRVTLAVSATEDAQGRPAQAKLSFITEDPQGRPGVKSAEKSIPVDPSEVVTQEQRENLVQRTLKERYPGVVTAVLARKAKEKRRTQEAQQRQEAEARRSAADPQEQVERLLSGQAPPRI